MSRLLIRSAAMALLTIATFSSAGATGSAPAIGQFVAAYARINDYTFVLHSHEARGSVTQDRVYSYEFMKPHFAKVRILSGQGVGNVAVWTGGDQISGRQSGLLSFVHVKVGLHDPRVLSLYGFSLTDGLLQHVVTGYGTMPAKLTQRSAGLVDGQPADVLELSIDPKTYSGIGKSQLFLSRASHMPLRQIFWSGTRIVLDQSYSDIKVNVGLKPSDFSL